MAFPETGILDDFAGTGALSGNWTADPIADAHPLGVRVGGAIAINTGQREHYQYWSNAQFEANQEAYLIGQAGVGDGGADSGVFLRLQSPGTLGCDGYAVEYWEEDGTIAIYRIGNGVFTQLGAAFSQVMGDGDGIGGWCEGTTIRAYYFNGSVWTLLGERIDTTFNLPGYIGCRVTDDSLTRTYGGFGGGTVFGPSITGSGVAVLGALTASGYGLLPTFPGGRFAYLVDIEPYGHGIRADPAVVPVGTPHVLIPAPDLADGIVMTYQAGLGIPLTQPALAAEIALYGRGVSLALCQFLLIPVGEDSIVPGRFGSGIAVLPTILATGFGDTGNTGDPPEVPPNFVLWREHTMAPGSQPFNGGQTYGQDGDGQWYARYSFAAGAAGHGVTYFNYGFGPGESVTAVIVDYEYRYLGGGNPASVPSANKHFYVRDQASRDVFYPSWKGNSHLELCVQEAAPSENHDPNVATPNIPWGQWHSGRLELNGDGSAKYYANGVLTHDFDPDTLWLDALTFTRVNFDSVPGGGTTAPWTLDYRNIRVYRPG